MASAGRLLAAPSAGVGGSLLGTNANCNNQFVSSSGIPNHMHVGTGPPPQFNRMEEMVKLVAWSVTLALRSAEAQHLFVSGL